MWQAYVDKYNKFQWWLSGILYGFMIGRFYQTSEGIRNIWNTQVVGEITRYHGVLLTFELKLLMEPTEAAIRDWLYMRGYTLVEHTEECIANGSVTCLCKSTQVAEMADA